MKFNIGDVIYVRSHTNLEKEGYGCWYGIRWTSQMDILEEQIVTVHQIDGKRYFVKPRDHSIGCMDGHLVFTKDIEAWFVDDSLELCKPKFENGTKVLVRKHSKDEKEQYPSHYSLIWYSCMDEFEGNVGTVTSFQINGHHYAYRISMNGDEWLFGEGSLIDAGYSLF